MKLKVVSSSKDFVKIAKGLQTFGVWFREGREPLIQKIIVPLDESSSNRYANVRNQAMKAAILQVAQHSRGV